MRKYLKLFFGILTCSIIVCCTMAVSVFAADYEGDLGGGFTWKLDSKTKTITIEGKGALPPYGVEYAKDGKYPFEMYVDQIEHIVIGEGITSIPNDLPLTDRSLTIGKDVNAFSNYGSATMPTYDPEEYIVAKGNPYFAVYDGALYRDDYKTILTLPSKIKETLKLHPKLINFRIVKNLPSKAYEIDSSNPYFSVYNGMLYSKDYTTLYQCPDGNKKYSFHPNLKTILHNGITNDTLLVIPEGVTTLEAGAISNWMTVVIPDSLMHFKSDREEDAITGRGLVICSKRSTAAQRISGGVAISVQVVSDEEFASYYNGNPPTNPTPPPSSNDQKEITTGNRDGWRIVNGEYAFYRDGSYVQQGWVRSNDKWYYLKSGRFVTGFLTINKQKYYLDKDGVMLTGLQRIDGKAYYFTASSGRMEHSKWKFADGDWYYLNAYGAGMVKYWGASAGKWYYLKEDGKMATNQWIEWYNKWYYVGSDGVMYVSRNTPDGYYVDASGVRIK